MIAMPFVVSVIAGAFVSASATGLAPSDPRSAAMPIRSPVRRKHYRMTPSTVGGDFYGRASPLTASHTVDTDTLSGGVAAPMEMKTKLTEQSKTLITSQACARAERRCVYRNDNYELEKTANQAASNSSLMSKPTGKGAFTILAQNRFHKEYHRDSVQGLKKTIELFYSYYNNKHKDDLIICHEGDFDDAAQKKVTEGRPEITFLQLGDENWEVYPPSIRGTNKNWKDGTFKEGYRKMIRWYAIKIWPKMAALGYDWVARWDDDSYLLSEIPYNLFSFMEQNGMDYAYRNTAIEGGMGILSNGLSWGNFLTNYVAQHRNGDAGWLQAEYFYNNFFVASVNRFMQPDIQHLLEAFDQSGAIFTNRWNDLIIQSAAVQMLIPKNKVHHFTGWSYGHNSGNGKHKLTYGIVQMGRDLNATEQCEGMTKALSLMELPADMGLTSVHGQAVTAANPGALC